jgi:hypothetical protein
MDPPGDRFEIVDGQLVGIEAAVPTHDVEGMVGVGVVGQPVALAHQHLAGTGRLVATGEEGLFGPVQVAFAVGAVLEELAGRRQVARRRADVAPGLDDQRVHRLATRLDHPAVRRAGGDHHVVARVAFERPEDRVEAGAALPHVDDLVAGGVAVQTARLGGLRREQPHVGVGQEQRAVGDQVAAAGERARPQVAGQERLVGAEAGVLVGHRLRGDQCGRGMAVVQQRRRRGEALGAHQLLGVERAARVPELGVALGRDVTHPSVVGHGRLRVCEGCA